jgi:hypothetical protein
LNKALPNSSIKIQLTISKDGVDGNNNGAVSSDEEEKSNAHS